MQNALQEAPTLSARRSLASWSVRRWWFAAGAAVLITLLIGLPTDVVPNPVFGRPVPVTWWSYPTLVATAVLGGLLAATYVREPAGRGAAPDLDDELDAPSRLGGVGGLVSFFAVGCPVCNKVVIVALGTTGARQWFEPLQPLLAVLSIALLAYALRVRLRGELACPVPR